MTRIMIRTASGAVHVLDHDARTLVRLPRAAEPREGNSESRALRRDEETLRVLDIHVLQIGAPMIAFLEPLGEGNATMRTTSTVLEITKLDD